MQERELDGPATSGAGAFPITPESTAAQDTGDEREARQTVRPPLVRAGLFAAASGVLAAGLTAGLFWLGLYATPVAGAADLRASVSETPPRRPPIIPPSVPLGAREDWAVWTYVYKINEAWGKDWPLVIQWFEELDARYPGNPMVLDKLYVSYLEDGRRLQEAGDLAGARMRYDQAAQFDPDRGVAQALLDELDALEDAR